MRAKDFDELPARLKRDLTAWFNRHEADVDTREKDLLFRLAAGGGFRAWNCPTCELLGIPTRVYRGDPERAGLDWGDFQGACNQDLSYFGHSEIYTKRTIRRQCDHCRCWGCPEGLSNAQGRRATPTASPPPPGAQQDLRETPHG